MAKLLDFSIKRIKALKLPASGRVEYRDTKVAGLYLRVSSNGVKSFSVLGRPKGGAPAGRKTLGKFPQVKPDEARTEALEFMGQLAKGISVQAASRARSGEMTLAELWTPYFAFISKTNKDPASTERLWTGYVGPRWATKRLSDVSALDVEAWFLNLPADILKRRAEKATALEERDAARRAEIAARQAIRRHGPDPKPKPATPRNVAKKVTGHVTANKSLELLRAMYNFAADGKRKFFVGVNPAANHQPFHVRDRERFIHPDEMAPFFESLAEEANETVRDAILVALLTGQRRANVLAMRWSEVHLGRGEWTIPGEQTKGSEIHNVPLVPEAVELLRRRREEMKIDEAIAEGRGEKVDFVFPSTRSKTGHIGDPKSAWHRVLGRADIANLIPHDLRRTNGSWQARDGASLVLIGKGLGHKTPEATAIYARLDLDPVRRSMTSATSAMFTAGGIKPLAEIIPIKKKGGKARSDDDERAA